MLKKKVQRERENEANGQNSRRSQVKRAKVGASTFGVLLLLDKMCVNRKSVKDQSRSPKRVDSSIVLARLISLIEAPTVALRSKSRAEKEVFVRLKISFREMTIVQRRVLGKTHFLPACRGDTSRG